MSEKYDKNRPCEMCGDHPAKSEYYYHWMDQAEWMKRICNNCGHHWYEEPLNPQIKT
jgi:ribosomal protein S27AE